jgi:thiol-disulfide isomerase/thioredoxin
MALITRRGALAGGTLAAALAPRKPRAATLPDLATVLRPISPPQDAPDIVFGGEDGTQHRLTEFRGHGMVINFWATWCAPCVAEMPSLSALSKLLAPSDIAVLPLSSDRGGVNAVSRWFQDHNVSGLPILTDPKGEAARAFGSRGIPTTVVVDRQGRQLARLEGAADWSTPAAAALIQRLVNG